MGTCFQTYDQQFGQTQSYQTQGWSCSWSRSEVDRCQDLGLISKLPLLWQKPAIILEFCNHAGGRSYQHSSIGMFLRIILSEPHYVKPFKKSEIFLVSSSARYLYKLS